MAIREENAKEYAALEVYWKSILVDASLASPSLQTSSPTNGPGGDESEEGDVISKIKERKYRIEKDVVRTDRQIPFFSSPVRLDMPALPEVPEHDGGNGDLNELRPLAPNLEILRNVLLSYTIKNFESGYVQGMNDLLAPILVIMQNDADSFYAFSHFMDTRMQVDVLF
jgi:hypothetical protein